MIIDHCRAVGASLSKKIRRPWVVRIDPSSFNLRWSYKDRDRETLAYDILVKLLNHKSRPILCEKEKKIKVHSTVSMDKTYCSTLETSSNSMPLIKLLLQLASSIGLFVLWNDTSFALPHLSLCHLHEQGVQY